MSIFRNIVCLFLLGALCAACGHPTKNDAPRPEAKKINWGEVNPAQAKAVPIARLGNPDAETECLLCHEDYIEAFGQTRHAKALTVKLGKKLGTLCEQCHGPLSLHLKGKTREERKGAVVSFKKLAAGPRNAICLQCHQKGQVLNWRGNPHDMAQVACNNCHYLSKRQSQHKLTLYETPQSACFQCHQDKRAQLLRTSHMPQWEGRMGCSDCHNPHGGTNESLLRKATVNQTCFQCHQEKRGPFIWEHPPSMENCANCHEPHGSNFTAMLKRNVPYLCQNCHMTAFHTSIQFEGQSLNNSAQQLMGKGCLNCHSLIHGSNHPSGARFQR